MVREAKGQSKLGSGKYHRDIGSVALKFKLSPRKNLNSENVIKYKPRPNQFD